MSQSPGLPEHRQPALGIQFRPEFDQLREHRIGGVFRYVGSARGSARRGIAGGLASQVV